MASPSSPAQATAAPTSVAHLALAGGEMQKSMHEASLTHTEFMAKQKHQPVAIFIGIIVFLALMIALYFFTKWRFGQIVDDKVPKKNSAVDGSTANAALKSSLSGMDGLQMALLFGAGAVAIGCAYAYLLSKKRSELEQGLGLHAKTSASLAKQTHSYDKIGALAGI